MLLSKPTHISATSGRHLAVAKMGLLHLANSTEGGQELKTHLKLATSYLAISIGPLTRFSAPLRLRGQLQLAPQVKPARAKPAEIERPIDSRKVDNHPMSQAELKEIRAFIDAAITQALDKLARERDLRVQRVLDKAHKRQERRDKAYGAIVKAAPAAPKGLLATFQQKGHQQALVVWQASKDAAAKLVEQAKRLGQRLLEASGAKRLVDWAQETLKRQQPELVAPP